MIRWFLTVLVIIGLVFVILLQISTNALALRAPTERPVRMVLTHTRALANRGTLGQNVNKVNHYNNSILYILLIQQERYSVFIVLPVCIVMVLSYQYAL